MEFSDVTEVNQNLNVSESNNTQHSAAGWSQVTLYKEWQSTHREEVVVGEPVKDRTFTLLCRVWNQKSMSTYYFRYFVTVGLGSKLSLSKLTG